MFERLELLIGKDNVKKLNNTKVLVIGLGGVGGILTETLVRNGIENITIIDNDKIDITNLNRQIISNHKNIGEFKVDEWKKRINEINPDCKVNALNMFVTKDNIDALFKNKVDYIIDACDTIETKKALIRVADNKNIKIISSMGTGNKLDATKLELTDIRKTSYDPIAKILRKTVKDEKIKIKIPVIYSKEEPIKTNSNVISSNSFVPAISGLLITSYIINDIIDKELIYDK